MLSALSVPGLAQTPDPGKPFPAPTLPESRFLEPQAPQLDYALPDAATLVPRDKRLSSGTLIEVSAFEFTGNSVFPPTALHEIAQPFLNRPIGNEDLEELRLRLTRLYVNAGYINSGVVIPDQEVRAGTLRLQIVEGVLNAIEFSGNHHFSADYLAARLSVDDKQPLRVATLQERMQLLLQNPQIERINAELVPGQRLGESSLRAAVHEAPRHTIGMMLANNRAPNVGSLRWELMGATRNLLGVADSWTLRYGKTRGIDDLSLAASIPVSRADTTVDLRYEKNTAQVVEAPFDDLNIENRSRNSEIGIRHPLFRSTQQSLTVGATLAARTSTTWLDGQRFSFTPAAHAGETSVGVMRYSLEWLDKGQDHVFSLRGVISRGLDAFGATRNPAPLPDAHFVARLLQTQWIQRLNEAGATLLLRADVQSAGDPLFPLEKFALGGMDSVRGFRENQLIRDNGWLASVELRWPIARLEMPLLPGASGEGQIALALFADTGKAWDSGGRKQALWGAGPGLRWDMTRDSFAQIYWAGARKHVQRDANDLQDRGIHFKLVMHTHF